MPFEQSCHINASLVDKNKKLRLSNLFLLLQDVAGKHAEKLGVGKSATTDVGLKWMVVRYYIEFYDVPSYGDTVTIGTYPGNANPFFFYRYFYIKDKNGNKIIKASSIWVIIDNKTNKIISNPFIDKIEGECFDDELPIPAKIVEDTNNKIKNVKIEYSDIDINGHVNNVRYIEMIQDINDSDFYKNHQYRTFLINYSNEIKENDVVGLYRDINDEYELIKGTVHSKESFKAKATYIKK